MAGDGLHLGFGVREGWLFGFEVEGVCREKGSPIRCGVEFNNSGSITQLGPYGMKEFPANSDIVGIGVLVGLGIPCLLIVLMAALVGTYNLCRSRQARSRRDADEPDYHGRRRRLKRNLSFTVGDFALIFGLGYIISFLQASKCELSYYHYYIVMDATVILFSTIILSTRLLLQGYWRVYTSIVRFMGTLLLAVLMGMLLINQQSMGLFPEWFPPADGRNDSAMLLPASCFLDPDLVERDNPFSQGPGALEDPAQLARLGETSSVTAEFCFWVVLLVLLIATHVEIFYRWKTEGIQPPSRKLLVWRVLVWLVHISIDGTCVYHILALRAWMHGSGWMDVLSVKEEENPFELGQFLPILGIAGIVMVCIESLKKPKEVSARPPGQGAMSYGSGQARYNAGPWPRIPRRPWGRAKRGGKYGSPV